MSGRCIPWLAGALLGACVLLGGLQAACARPVQTLDLDRDVPEADVIAIVKITSSTFREAGWYAMQGMGRRKPTPVGTGYRIDFHDVKATILLPIKGTGTTGSSLLFRHRRAAANKPQPPNGFWSHAFKPGETCLLVLRKESDGVLAVPFPEQRVYALYPQALVEALPARASEASDLDYVLDLLFARFDHGKTPDDPGIDILAFLMRSKAGLAQARAPARAARICKRLASVVDRDLGSGGHGRVLWVLRELGQPVPTAKVIRWILDPKLAQHRRTNLIGLLALAPTPDFVAALERIIRDSRNEEVVKTATRQLTYALAQLKREQEAERRVRASKQR